jgi:hypothetical protein
MVFDAGFKIPFYNPGSAIAGREHFPADVVFLSPDHGPTVSQEEAEPDLPERLKAITQVRSILLRLEVLQMTGTIRRG